MERIKASLLFSFRAKVILPVVAVMVLLMAVSMWLVNLRITKQLQDGAAELLVTADAVLKNSHETRTDNFYMRYRNVVNQSRIKAVTTTTDQKTVGRLLDELIGESAADVITLAIEGGPRLTAARDPRRLNRDDFANSCAISIAQALNGESSGLTIRNGDRLFDIVSLPIRVGDEIKGAVTFGVENSVAQEFKRATKADLILIGDGQIVADTLQRPDLYERLTTKLAQLSTLHGSSGFKPIEQITLNDEHYLCRAGNLNPPAQHHKLEYLILSSYERPLQVLRATQTMILIVSALAILLGSAVVWFLISKVTAPLRELADTAEAVGRGDFSRRVEVRSKDECGELADVFNRMTEGLKNSREQLEHTVESLKTTQAQLIQSEKLSGIGEFVAGVAHELNNPLTSVIGFSELLRMGDQEPKHRRYVDTILKSAQRCQKIVQALLSFARRHQPERKPVCLNGLVEAALEILQYQLRTSNIELITRFDPKLPQAMVDPHQIQQVYLNLINNARQAIEAHQPKGWIKITTEARGDNVRVSIQDNGPGISEDNLSKIFDPFFTTKEVGTGTGLGLSLCYGIIKEHGGTIVPRSRPGEGATFTIELPITNVAEETATGEPSMPPADVANTREGAGRKVLVIDDEEPILEMVRDTLIPRGYHVDVASDGEAGLRRLSETQYDVTLCDWKMPGLNGKEVYERVREKSRTQSERIIFITGDMVSQQTRRFLEDRKCIWLPKPFTLAEFRSALGKVLTAA